MLEVDEHSADAGMITRCEAFLDSVRGTGIPKQSAEDKRDFAAPSLVSIVKERTIYYPFACGAVHALAAASRGFISCMASPMPTLSTILVSFGTCIILLYEKSFISFGTISFLYLSFNLDI